jgi:hypothetical protein
MNIYEIGERLSDEDKALALKWIDEELHEVLMVGGEDCSIEDRNAMVLEVKEKYINNILEMVQGYVEVPAHACKMKIVESVHRAALGYFLL